MKNKYRLFKKLLVFMLLFTMESGFLMAQTWNLSGTISDTRNEPIPGASILIKGTTKGTTSDANGNFRIDVSKGATLKITYMGFLAQEISIAENKSLKITLQEETKALDEVVVIGYGTRAKGELTGAVTKVDSKVFQQRPITNTLDALQGALAGVTVTRNSGRPGNEGFSLQIRGYSSMNGNKPLVLIDGVPGDISVINPGDIADITVLKDAAAAIYGARAADGVLMITTKKGKAGKTAINYSFNLGFKTPHYLKKMVNTRQLAEMYDEGMRNVGQPGLSQDVFDRINSGATPDPNGGWMKYLENFPGFYGNTDWNKEIYGKSMQQSHNISLSGGGENQTFLTSAGYEKNEGTFNYGLNYSDRYNLRLNYDFRVLKRVRLETRTTFEQLNTVEPSLLDLAIYGFSRAWSYLPVRTPEGRFYKYQGYQNPASVLEEGGTSKSKYSKFSTNIKTSIDILEGLKLVGQASTDLSFWHKTSIYKTFQAYNWDESEKELYNNPNSSGFENASNLFNTLTSYIDFDRSFGKHQLNLIAGGSYELYNTEGQYIWGKNYTNNTLFTLNLADKSKLEYSNGFGGNASSNAISSYFSQFGYNFNHQLFLDFTLRKDGSSKFASSKRWSELYPSVSAGWKISELNFLKGLSALNNLKIRGSWGKSGNQEINFGNYDYIPLLYQYGNYPFGSPNVGLIGAESGIASSDRSWESIESMNAGIDFALFNSRLSGSFDYFIKHNNNMLVYVERPAVFGGTAPTSNDGKLETKGWEAMIGWNDHINDFRYSVSFTMSDSKNELVDLKGSDSYNEGIVWARQGYSLNSIFGYQFAGIIQNQQELTMYKQYQGVPYSIGIGDAMYEDLDNDGIISAYGDPSSGTTGDMTYLGNKFPRYSYSSNIDLSYEGFSLSMIFQGVGKRNTIRTGDFAQPYYWVWHQPLAYFYGQNWTEENTDARYPRIIPGGIGADVIRDWNGRISSNRIENVSYLRLKQITLGYDLPLALCKKMQLDGVRIYFSGKDILTFSKGTWNDSFDPEEDRSDWLSEATYPFYKVYSVGADIKF